MPIRIMRDYETYPVVEATAMAAYPEKKSLVGPREGSVQVETLAGEWIFRVVCPEDYREASLRRGYAACLREAARRKVRHLLIHLLQPKSGSSREALKLALDTLCRLPEAGELDILLCIPGDLKMAPSRRQELDAYFQQYEPRNFGRVSRSMGASKPMPPMASSMPMPPMAPPMPPMAPAPKKAKIPMEVDAGFSETLLSLIDRKGKKDSEIYNKANVSRQHFSKIRNNPDYKPTKATALAFAIALELSMEETRDLIGRAGYALTRSSKFDLIIMYFIERKNYNLFDINEALYEYDQSLLGA